MLCGGIWWECPPTLFWDGVSAETETYQSYLTLSYHVPAPWACSTLLTCLLPAPVHGAARP